MIGCGFLQGDRKYILWLLVLCTTYIIWAGSLPHNADTSGQPNKMWWISKNCLTTIICIYSALSGRVHEFALTWMWRTYAAVSLAPDVSPVLSLTSGAILCCGWKTGWLWQCCFLGLSYQFHVRWHDMCGQEVMRRCMRRCISTIANKTGENYSSYLPRWEAHFSHCLTTNYHNKPGITYLQNPVVVCLIWRPTCG